MGKFFIKCRCGITYKMSIRDVLKKGYKNMYCSFPKCGKFLCSVTQCSKCYVKFFKSYKKICPEYVKKYEDYSDDENSERYDDNDEDCLYYGNAEKYDNEDEDEENNNDSQECEDDNVDKEENKDEEESDESNNEDISQYEKCNNCTENYIIKIPSKYTGKCVICDDISFRRFNYCKNCYFVINYPKKYGKFYDELRIEILLKLKRETHSGYCSNPEEFSYEEEFLKIDKPLLLCFKQNNVDINGDIDISNRNLHYYLPKWRWSCGNDGGSSCCGCVNYNDVIYAKVRGDLSLLKRD